MSVLHAFLAEGTNVQTLNLASRSVLRSSSNVKVKGQGRGAKIDTVIACMIGNDSRRDDYQISSCLGTDH